MSVMESLNDAKHKHFWNVLDVVKRVIEAGADINVLDKVSYSQAPYYNNQVLLCVALQRHISKMLHKSIACVCIILLMYCSCIHVDEYYVL